MHGIIWGDWYSHTVRDEWERQKERKGELEEGESDIAEVEVCLGGVQRARGVNKSVDDSDAPHCNK